MSRGCPRPSAVEMSAVRARTLGRERAALESFEIAGPLPKFGPSCIILLPILKALKRALPSLQVLSTAPPPSRRDSMVPLFHRRSRHCRSKPGMSRPRPPSVPLTLFSYTRALQPIPCPRSYPSVLEESSVEPPDSSESPPVFSARDASARAGSDDEPASRGPRAPSRQH